MALVKILVLTLLLIALTVFLGTQGCGLGTCFYVSLPIIMFSSIVVGIIVAFLAKGIYLKKGQTIFFPLFLGIIFAYMIAGPILGFVSLNYFHKLNNKQFEGELNKDALKQDFRSVVKGKITDSGSRFTYICLECGYQVSFPKTWGFSESDTVISNFYNGVGDVFTVVTPNYDTSINMPKGGKISIYSTNNTILQQIENHLTKNPYTLPVKEVIINGNSVKMVFDPDASPHSPSSKEVAWLTLNNRYFVIYADFADAKEFEENLKILLSGN